MSVGRVNDSPTKNFVYITPFLDEVGRVIDSTRYADGTPRRTACMSFKDTGSGKITLNFTVSIYAESNAVLHYLLVSYFKDKNGIYKVYLGFRKESGIFGHDAVKVEQYGTF